MLAPYLTKPREAKKVVANLLAAPGKVAVTRDAIDVRLAPAANVAERRAIGQLFAAINQRNLTLPGDRHALPLRLDLHLPHESDVMNSGARSPRAHRRPLPMPVADRGILQSTKNRLRNREAPTRDSATALLNVLAVYVPIAGESCGTERSQTPTGDRPARTVLSTLQLRVLRTKLGANFPVRPTVADALMAIAALGGHLRRNGEPGWQTLARGYERLLTLEEGAQLGAEMRWVWLFPTGIVPIT